MTEVTPAGMSIMRGLAIVVKTDRKKTLNMVLGCWTMRTISTDGFEKPKLVCAGAAPTLGWLLIADLVINPSYRRSIANKSLRSINRIAAAFSWSRFTPLVVAPWENGKFVIIDGQIPRHGCGACGL